MAGFDGPDAVPVVFGWHRRAQNVIVTWQLWPRIVPAVETPWTPTWPASVSTTPTVAG